MNDDLNLYFLTDEYYLNFPDKKLMIGKKVVNGRESYRPFFYSFQDDNNPEILWFVPISSQVKKYRKIESRIIKRYGECNTIRFGKVLDRDAAFLIQNMCPVTKKYLIPYMNRQGMQMSIGAKYAADIRKNARTVLELAKRGNIYIYPDVFTIYAKLEKELQCGKNDSDDGRQQMRAPNQTVYVV